MPEVTLKMEKLREQLLTPESFNDFSAFRRRVLEKSQEDIHKYTSLKFEWETIKKGRAVKAIRFIFSNRQLKQLEEQKKAVDTQKESQMNNDAMQKASSCFTDHKKNNKLCVPQDTKHCSICLQYIKKIPSQPSDPQ